MGNVQLRGSCPAPGLTVFPLTLHDVSYSRIHDSPSSSGLATPPRSPSPDPARSSSNTPKAGRSPYVAQTELPWGNGGGTSPTVTPTEGTPNLRYPKLILGFPPLPSFLRSRTVSQSLRPTARSTAEQNEEDSQYSTSSVVGPASDLSESEELARPNGGEDDDDRQTIKGMDIQRRPSVESKTANGHVTRCDPATTQEKFPDGPSPVTPSSTTIHSDQ